MAGIRHPYSRDLYEPAGDDLIRVTRNKDGQSGLYGKEGQYIEGAKIDVDPQLCGWVASPRGAHRMVAKDPVTD
jgi:hypothetical protein